MMKSKSRKAIAVWLYTCAVSVFLMAIIGAVTRLTESGLSIVEWKPITGALPPLDPVTWQAEFDLYKETPQYRQINTGMSLEEFKRIYFWEWLHRLWGRVIGLIFFVPFAFFCLRKRLPAASVPWLAGIIFFGALQGGMGWFMVTSGLVDVPAVSHYRLAAHLLLAVIIYLSLIWVALLFSVEPDRDGGRLSPMRPMIQKLLGLVLMTVTWGAFVAGLRAGKIYNTFPKMDAYWLPPELFKHQPLWMAFFEEPATVQFTHRILAILTFMTVIALFPRAVALNAPPRLRELISATAVVAVIQLCLGIATLLTGVNLVWAVAHQAGALVLAAMLVWLLYEIPKVSYDR